MKFFGSRYAEAVNEVRKLGSGYAIYNEIYKDGIASAGDLYVASEDEVVDNEKFMFYADYDSLSGKQILSEEDRGVATKEELYETIELLALSLAASSPEEAISVFGEEWLLDTGERLAEKFKDKEVFSVAKGVLETEGFKMPSEVPVKKHIPYEL